MRHAPPCSRGEARRGGECLGVRLPPEERPCLMGSVWAGYVGRGCGAALGTRKECRVICGGACGTSGAPAGESSRRDRRRRSSRGRRTPPGCGRRYLVHLTYFSLLLGNLLQNPGPHARGRLDPRYAHLCGDAERECGPVADGEGRRWGAVSSYLCLVLLGGFRRMICRGGAVLCRREVKPSWMGVLHIHLDCHADRYHVPS
jgi:hypothetical protein